MNKTKHQLGRDGENLACRHLINNNVKILGRNIKSYRSCELDIVALENNTLLFIEVKYRKSRRHGQPEEAVTKAKQLSICKGATYYRALHPNFAHLPIRFDVIAISENKNTTAVTWYKNAFEYICFSDSFTPL